MSVLNKEACKRSTPLRVRKRKSPVESESDEDEPREPLRKTIKPTISEEPETPIYGYAKKSRPLNKPEATKPQAADTSDSQDVCEVIATSMPPTPPTPPANPTPSIETVNKTTNQCVNQHQPKQQQQQQDSSEPTTSSGPSHTCLVAQLSRLIESHNKFIEAIRNIFNTLANQPDNLCRSCCERFEPNVSKNHAST